MLVLVAVWAVVNFVQGPSRFFSVAIIGLTNGSVYALVALGYTLVYGILQLINFAHGDVFALGRLLSATFILDVFNVASGSGGPGHRGRDRSHLIAAVVFGSR